MSCSRRTSSQLIEAHSQVPEVMIAWQGGEPTLMGVDFFRRSVELADQHLKPGQRAVYTIQTNGTLLDEEWAAFFSRERLPRRDLDRRTARAPRRLPREQGRQGLVRPGDGRPRAPEGRRGGVERADDDPRRERRPRPRGLLLPARRVRGELRPVHPHHRARLRGDGRGGALVFLARPAAVRAEGRAASRTAR